MMADVSNTSVNVSAAKNVTNFFIINYLYYFNINVAVWDNDVPEMEMDASPIAPLY